jgi:MFS family permease
MLIAILFTVTTDFILLIACRFIMGLSQVFIMIFLPVWADKYASTPAKKQCWLTGILFGTTVGVLFGYVITAAFIAYVGWRWAFYFQAMSLFPIFSILLFTPLKYLNISEDDTENKVQDESTAV